MGVEEIVFEKSSDFALRNLSKRIGRRE